MQSEKQKSDEELLSHLPYISADTIPINELRTQRLRVLVERQHKSALQLIDAQIRAVEHELIVELGVEGNEVTIPREDLIAIIARAALRGGMQIIESISESLQETRDLETSVIVNAA